MNTYKISCFSNCPSYVAAYHKTVTVKAGSKEEAITLCKEWLKQKQQEFLYPEAQWGIIELYDKKGVIDYCDY
jgi:hypothetical protein